MVVVTCCPISLCLQSVDLHMAQLMPLPLSDSLSAITAVQCMCSGQKVAVVDLSVHKLDANTPHIQCSRAIAKLLADLSIPPFIVRNPTLV